MYQTSYSDSNLYSLFYYFTLYKELSYVVIGSLRKKGQTIQQDLEANDKALLSTADYEKPFKLVM
jgi:hypothetical protein